MMCGGILPLIVKYRALLIVYTLSEMTALGTHGVPAQKFGVERTFRTTLEYILTSKDASITYQLKEAEKEFRDLEIEPSEDQIKQVLHVTDRCSDLRAGEILNDPKMSRDVTLIFYLDLRKKIGKEKTIEFFHKRDVDKKKSESG